jgi:hypothetical protein
MEGKKTYTVNEVLKITVDKLGAILVPASLGEQIARPIYESINNLRECIAALEQAEAQQAASHETETETGKLFSDESLITEEEYGNEADPG